MRILVLTPTFLPVIGGAELVLWEVYRRLATKHDVVLLTPRLSDVLLKHYSKSKTDYPVNFKVIRYEDKKTLMALRGHKISGGAIPPFSISAVSAVKKVLKDFKAQVLNVHYVMPTGLAGAIANTVWKIPTVLTFNGRDVPGPGVPPLWKYWHRFIARFCTDLTYVSEYCRDIIFGPQGRGVVTWNGVDFKKIKIKEVKPPRQTLGIKRKNFILFALQRLSKEKRVDVLLKSMRCIVDKIPNTEMIIGGTGPEKEKLIELSNRLNLRDKVRFTGFIPDAEIGNYFNLCDVFVFYSTYETFGIVLAQAMAFGKPIVSILSTAIPSVVKDKECGLLVLPNKPEKMAEAVIKLLNNKRLRKQLGANGRKRAESLFDWDVVAKKYEDVFFRAIKL
ncbi:MAG: glycosyltransferase family 4 protein [Candidatus Aminicenantes bacterium]|nr:glycosyltransferase family 4 protein [Candidatus Aminicenantes bacterium]